MAKVIQIIDVDSDGHKVRLDSGAVIVMPHGGPVPSIGEEISVADQSNNQPVNEAPAPAAEIPTGDAGPDSTDEPLPLDPAAAD